MNRSLYSDLHKDVYGFRPSAAARQWAATCSDEEFRAEWDSLMRALEYSMAEEKRQEALALNEWNRHIYNLMIDHGVDRATAIRWDMEAEGTGPDYEYYCWSRGLAYSMAGEIEHEVRQ